MQVIVPTLPVTGMRLHLEGKKNNRLAKSTSSLCSYIFSEMPAEHTAKLT